MVIALQARCCDRVEAGVVTYLGLFADIGAAILVPASVARGMPDGVAPVELDDVDDNLDACLVSRSDGASPAGAACTEAPARHVLIGDIPLRLASRARASDRR